MHNNVYEVRQFIRTLVLCVDSDSPKHHCKTTR